MFQMVTGSRGALAELMERWKQAGAGGGDEDEALWHRFKTARSRFFDRRSEHGAEVRENRRTGQQAKEDLITQAEALNSSTDWGATFDAMQDLMEQWKGAPSAGRKTDDELWNRFRAAREPFFEARKKQFAENRRQQSRGPRDQGHPRGRSQAPRDRGGSASPGNELPESAGSGGETTEASVELEPLQPTTPTRQKANRLPASRPAKQE